MKIKKIIVFLLLLVPFSAFLTDSNVLYPDITLKNLVIRLLVVIAALLSTFLFWQNPIARLEITNRLRSIFKQKIIVWLSIFLGIVLLGVFFAPNTQLALWGELERGEGFITLFFFFIYIILLLVHFSRQDWLTIFKVILFSGIFLFFKQLAQLANHLDRPSATVGNPSFLADYYLLVTAAAVVLIAQVKSQSKKYKKWNITFIASGFGILNALVGIFISQSRGPLLGYLLGIFVALIWFVCKSERQPNYRKVTRIATGVLVFLILFSGIFVLTRRAKIWQDVPVLGRLTVISITDATTASRIINSKIALNSVDPAQEGLKPLLIGWGWDNYIFAWYKHYDPNLYQYDIALFDRTHNKLLDVLTMSGIFGLIAYLALWITLFMSLWRKNIGLIVGVFIFLAVAHFTQNLVAFESIVPYITFFLLIAFATHLNEDSNPEKDLNKKFE